MLHTAHMFCKINTEYYSALSKTLYKLTKLNKTRCYNKKNRTHCELLKKNGLNITLIRTECEDGISYSALEIIMNPARLLNENEYYQLTDFHHYDSVKKAFEKAFKPVKKAFEKDKRNKLIKFKLHKIDFYSFKRVDFAVNIVTEFSEIYMELIRRGSLPESFNFKEIKNSKSKRNEPPKDSFYIERKDKVGKNTVTINCYSKEKQLKNQKLPCDDKKAMYTIRFEVQCYYCKTYRITRSIEFSKQVFLYLLRSDVSAKILHYYFKRLCSG